MRLTIRTPEPLMRTIPVRLSSGRWSWGANFFDTAIVCQSGASEQSVDRTIQDFARLEDMWI